MTKTQKIEKGGGVKMAPFFNTILTWGGECHPK